MNENIEISQRRRSIELAQQILEEVARKDVVLKTYTDSIDDIRLGLALTQDSVENALREYQVYKLTRNWQPVRINLIDAVVHIIRLAREIQ